MVSNETPYYDWKAMNAEALQIAMKIIATKKTKEIQITLECDCVVLISPKVMNSDDAFHTKMCEVHDKLV